MEMVLQGPCNRSITDLLCSSMYSHVMLNKVEWLDVGALEFRCQQLLNVDIPIRTPSPRIASTLNPKPQFSSQPLTLMPGPENR